MDKKQLSPVMKVVIEIVGFAILYFGAWFIYCLVSKQSFAQKITEPSCFLVPILYVAAVIILAVVQNRKKK